MKESRWQRSLLYCLLVWASVALLFTGLIPLWLHAALVAASAVLPELLIQIKKGFAVTRKGLLINALAGVVIGVGSLSYAALRPLMAMAEVETWRQQMTFVYFAALFLAFGGVLIACAFDEGCRDFVRRQFSAVHPAEKTDTISLRSLSVLFISAVSVITLCSKSSPLYPFNNWDDANCFLTVGRSLLRGRVLYRDIFEQKGPLLYFLQALCALISPDSFLGVWLLEIIACFLFLAVAYRMLLLFCPKGAVAVMLPMAVCIYSSGAMSHGGSVEELCLPCAAYCFYVGLEALMKRQAQIPLHKCFLLGVTAGIVLWIKFSLLGIYIGFAIFFIAYYCKEKRLRELLRALGGAFGGLGAASVTVVVYFLRYGALQDLYEVYFYDNLFLYSVKSGGNILSGLLTNLLFGLLSMVENNAAVFALIVLGGIYAAGKQRYVLLYHLLLCVSSYFFIYSGGRHYQYYSFILCVFVPLGFVPVYYLLQELRGEKPFSRTVKRLGAGGLYLVCMGLALCVSPNTYMLRYQKEDLPQYAFREIMQQEDHPTLLNYGFLDGGFYTVSGIDPTCKYFCGLNLPYDPIKKTQDEFVRNGETDFVVTKGHGLTPYHQIHYECVGFCRFETEAGQYTDYYLFRRRKTG